jgi:hypothetical protein
MMNDQMEVWIIPREAIKARWGYAERFEVPTTAVIADLVAKIDDRGLSNVVLWQVRMIAV